MLNIGPFQLELVWQMRIGFEHNMFEMLTRPDTDNLHRAAAFATQLILQLMDAVPHHLKLAGHGD